MRKPAYVQMMYDIDSDFYYVSVSDENHDWIEDACFGDAQDNPYMDAIKQFRKFQRKSLLDRGMKDVV